LTLNISPALMTLSWLRRSAAFRRC
jgi:hypothetical protein